MVRKKQKTSFLPEGSTQAEKSSKQIISPVKVEAALPVNRQPKVVKLHNIRSGNTVEMGFKAATSLAHKFPREYKLV
jgi:hypothetical protein